MSDMAEKSSAFSTEYAAQLYSQAVGDIGGPNESGLSAGELVEQLHDRRYASSTMQPDEVIPYVRVGEASERPVLYVPGFTEGIEAKAPFAVELAKYGQEVILPGQNRAEILKDAITDKHHATYSQAQNYLDVLRTEGLADKRGSVHVVTHSYGSLIFDAMHKIAAENGLPCFTGAKVAMLAPAGLNSKENFPKLVARFGLGMARENFVGKDFPDETGEMLRAGLKNMFANIPRSLREGMELATRRVDYERLLTSELASLAILSYAKDGVFPYRIARQFISRAFEVADGAVEITWATPISLGQHPKAPERIRGGHDASHNDEQFNPSRAAGAVMRLLRPR